MHDLRHTAKEVLALAALDLFPGTTLVGGGVDEIGFYYDFLFPKEILTLFSERELRNIEDRMIRIIHENHPIKQLEMMRENGAAYLEHIGHSLRAKEALNAATNIVSLIEIGSFRDLCPPPYLKQTNEIKAFKLQGFKENGFLRIYGTAFLEKRELKIFLKQYKAAAKRDPQVIGPKEGYFLPIEGEWIYLAKGELLLKKMRDFWDREHTSFERLVFSDTLDPQEVHASLMQKKKFTHLASFSFHKGDYVSIRSANKQELFEELISSLHFIEKAFKIFAFESRVYCLDPKLAPALEKANLPFEYLKGEAQILFRVIDGYGREKTLSYLGVERNEKVLHRSLFHSPQEWIAHMIEIGVEI